MGVIPREPFSRLASHHLHYRQTERLQGRPATVHTLCTMLFVSKRKKLHFFNMWGDAKTKPVSSKSHLMRFPSNRGARKQQPSSDIPGKVSASYWLFLTRNGSGIPCAWSLQPCGIMPCALEVFCWGVLSERVSSHFWWIPTLVLSDTSQAKQNRQFQEP